MEQRSEASGGLDPSCLPWRATGAPPCVGATCVDLYGRTWRVRALQPFTAIDGEGCVRLRAQVLVERVGRPHHEQWWTMADWIAFAAQAWA